MRVLRRGLWTIADLLMFLYKWTPNLADCQPTMRALPVWVTIKNIPHNLFSWEDISFISSSIGEPKKLHQETEMCVRFEEAKVLIEVDLTKELPTEFLAQDNDGTVKRISFIYPKIPQVCSKCKHWGHTNQSCSTQPTNITIVSQPSTPASLEEIVKLPIGHDLNNAMEVDTTKVVTAKETTPILSIKPSIAPTADNMLPSLLSVTFPTSINDTLAAGKSNSTSSVLEKNDAETSKVTSIEAESCQVLANSDHQQGLDREWKSVSPGTGIRSPLAVTTRNQIAISSSFNALLMEQEKMEEEGEIKETTMEPISNLNDIGKETNKEGEEATVTDASNDTASVITRPTSTRNRKPPVNYQTQNQPPSNPKRTQSMQEFQHLVNYCSILDITTQGPHFTWCNKREDELICKKLDRIMGNQQWISTFANSYGVYEVGGCSDHLRVRFRVDASPMARKIPFKFANALTMHPHFLDTVKDYWDQTPTLYTSTTTAYILAKKLQALKPILRRLGTQHLGNIQMRVKMSYEEMCRTQEINLTNPTNQNHRGGACCAKEMGGCVGY